MNRRLHSRKRCLTHEEEQEVRTRAYEIFLSRRKQGWKGDAMSDWLRAEQELLTAAPKDDPRER
jgi:hypothetical protein